MSKALKLLKEQLRLRSKYKGVSSMKQLIKETEEAISELEEAMKPKTCYVCKQSWEPNNQTFHKYFCEYLKIPVHGGFYCNRYEAKEQ